MSEILDSFVVGQLYSNAEIYKSFVVATGGGLRFRVVEDKISHAVLMTSLPNIRKLRENPYHDRIENGILTYTAAGRDGDQTLNGLNKRLPSQLKQDFPIHCFMIIANRDDKSVGPRRWRYLGLLEYIRHFQDSQIDTKGALRKVWIFEFRIHSEPSQIPLKFETRIMSEILSDSRRRNPTSEEERAVSVPEENSIVKIDPMRIEVVRSRLLSVEPERFEYLLKDLLATTGFSRIEVTKYSQDGGIDLNAHPGLSMWILGDWLIQIQAKRWIHTVGRKEVAELRGSLQPFARGSIVTTSHFSKAAIVEAREQGKNPIHLVDGVELSRIIIHNNAESII
jgi:hypothetical protein